MSHELRSQQAYGNFPSCSIFLWKCSSLYLEGYTEALNTPQYLQLSCGPPETTSRDEHVTSPLPFPLGTPSSLIALLSNSTIPPRHSSFLWWVCHFPKQCPSPSHCQAQLPPPLGWPATSCALWFKSCSPAKSSVFSVALHSVVKTRENPLSRLGF